MRIFQFIKKDKGQLQKFDGEVWRDVKKDTTPGLYRSITIGKDGTPHISEVREVEDAV